MHNNSRNNTIDSLINQTPCVRRRWSRVLPIAQQMSVNNENDHLNLRLDDVVTSEGNIGYVTQCAGGDLKNSLYCFSKKRLVVRST